MTKVVMTSSFRGGTGKSTIISNLGSYLASFGLKIVIVDADVVSPGVHAIFGLNQKTFSKTLTDYLKGGSAIEDAVYDISHNLALPDETLFLVPSSILQSDIAEFLEQKSGTDKLLKAITKLAKSFEPDYILIDTHPGLNKEVLVAFNSIDMLLNVVRPDNQDYQGLEVSAGIAARLKLKMYVVLNKVHHKLRNNKLRKKVESAFNVPVVGMLPLAEEIMLSQSQFIFSERYPEHPFSREMQLIAERVFGVRPKEHLEVMHDVLEEIVKNEKIESGELMHIKNISHNKLQFYIDELLKNGFVKRFDDSGKTWFVVSEKGKRFLNKYKSIRKFVEGFRL